MKEIGAREAAKGLGSLLEQVLQGETFVILRYGRPIAALGPAPALLRNEAAAAPKQAPAVPSSRERQAEVDRILAGSRRGGKRA